MTWLHFLVFNFKKMNLVRCQMFQIFLDNLSFITVLLGSYPALP